VDVRTFGTAELKDGKWVVQAEPHVLLRLKRTFASIRSKEQGRVSISDTIDNCRELAWFCDRYPLTVTPAARLHSRASEHRERETLVHSLLNGQTPARDFELAEPARDYQRVAADLALASGGLLIADDVGLGKTATAICALTDGRMRPALVVAPTHLQRQWQNEINRFAPQLETHILKKGTPYDYSKARARGRKKDDRQLCLVNPHPDVLICTYAKLAGWSETLGEVVRSVIYDEVHELRTGTDTGKGAAAAYLAERVAFRIGLSATPIFNYGGEIYNVLNALRPGALGDYGEFCTAWCGYHGEKPRLTDPAAFGSFARDNGIMIRRTREEVGRELPELVKAPHHVESDESALNAIASSAGELARIILAQNADMAKGEQFRAGGELDAMVRQATGIAKAPYVAQFVKMLLESGEKVVLFGWHHEVYRLWMESLAEFNPVLYTGNESENQKNEAKRKFVEGESQLLIISLRSGAGIDGLQYSGCRTVVFGGTRLVPGGSRTVRWARPP